MIEYIYTLLGKIDKAALSCQICEGFGRDETCIYRVDHLLKLFLFKIALMFGILLSNEVLTLSYCI